MTMLRNYIVSAMIVSAGIGAGASAQAGSITPAVYYDWVAPDGDTSFIELFVAGTPARVSLQGDCYSDIDLLIFDEFGNKVAQSLSYDCREDIVFWPAWTGLYTIMVENHGKPNWSEFILEA